jgi:hypothetical protein
MLYCHLTTLTEAEVGTLNSRGHQERHTLQATDVSDDPRGALRPRSALPLRGHSAHSTSSAAPPRVQVPVNGSVLTVWYLRVSRALLPSCLWNIRCNGLTSWCPDYFEFKHTGSGWNRVNNKDPASDHQEHSTAHRLYPSHTPTA